MKEIETNKTDNTVKITLNREFYTKKSVLLAGQAFSENCYVSLSIEEGAYSVIIMPKEDADLENLGLEFFNYALEIMQNE